MKSGIHNSILQRNTCLIYTLIRATWSPELDQLIAATAKVTLAVLPPLYIQVQAKKEAPELYMTESHQL